MVTTDSLLEIIFPYNEPALRITLISRETYFDVNFD